MPGDRTGFRARLRAPEPILGTFLKIPSTQPAEILATLGFDFVVIDEEHAPFNPETTDAILLACRAHGMAGLVRVRQPADILRVLDCGADGVLVPHVASPEIAREIVALARYSGARGLSPTTRAGTFGATDVAEHMRRQDQRCAVIAMIEDAECLDRIDAILATDGLDAIFIGRADLAASMGPAAANGGIERAVDLVLAGARDAGMPTLILSSDRTEADRFRSQGATGFLTMSDQGFLREQAARMRDIFSREV
ncbi:HpcH/HpaI aldolase family protein [Cereibacter johrii]|uniref:2-keto-3-deoxy-L-rhamnonate aldolase RhmA n=1 Tax=Cereibacter johrii TaxID=445629 RepID=A0ABX5J2D3_9RHOB|nr:aldolase/citrate lyase family protein [Cereibacter johrii]ODM43304.1 aldolase [Cereibacter johrii]PTM75569.1 2-keto-3-deoxy-L-rhamnonate aldolase RhmA [Cereibacter johrii]